MTQSVIEYRADGSIRSSAHYQDGKPTLETGSYSKTQQGATGFGGYTETTTTYTYEKVYDASGALRENRVTNTSTGNVSTYDANCNLIAGFDEKTGKTIVSKK